MSHRTSHSAAGALYPQERVEGSVDFCRRLLDEADVAAVPEEVFGMDSCVRFSFATSLDRIEEGLRPLRFLGRLVAWEILRSQYVSDISCP